MLGAYAIEVAAGATVGLLSAAALHFRPRRWLRRPSRHAQRVLPRSGGEALTKGLYDKVF